MTTLLAYLSKALDLDILKLKGRTWYQTLALEFKPLRFLKKKKKSFYIYMIHFYFS